MSVFSQLPSKKPRLHHFTKRTQQMKEACNYHPISVLPIMSKPMERSVTTAYLRDLIKYEQTTLQESICLPPPPFL